MGRPGPIGQGKDKDPFAVFRRAWRDGAEGG